MNAQEFIESLRLFKPNLEKVVNWGTQKEMASFWDKYALLSSNKPTQYVVKDLNNNLNYSIRIENFDIYGPNDWVFDNAFEEDGFYPFGFYLQDHLFIKVKTGQIEARDLTLTKFYDVAKDEQSFLDAFLVFAKHYSYHLENFNPDANIPLSIPIEQRRDILKDVLNIVGGKKYRQFWVQVFQAWSEKELKEME